MAHNTAQKRREYQLKWQRQNKQKVAAWTKAWRLANPEKDRLSKRLWRLANKQKIEDSRKAKVAQNPPKYREKSRKHHLSTRYGISEIQYENMFKNQTGVCLICKLSSTKQLVVDHDHKTGVVRGLLCGKCNLGLGMFYDRKELLIAAASYLDMFCGPMHI